MAKKTGAFRMNITIPNDLKKQMDKVGSDVNWSAAAAEAFRAKLLEVTSQRRVENMQDVIERLKASKERRMNEQYQVGLGAGKRWAESIAEAHELERLAAGPLEPSFNWADRIAVMTNGMNSGIAWGLYCDIQGENWNNAE